MPIQDYGLTIAQGIGSAQRADLVLSIQSPCHQRRPDCRGRFTITANYAQSVQLMQGAERRYRIDEAPTLRELEREVVANQLQLMRG